jgi:hypothetical protein
MQEELLTQPIRQRSDLAACSGKFADGRPCPAAAKCDRYQRGVASTSPWQVWSQFEADESGERCEQFSLYQEDSISP